jgi:hypothetical protein
VARLPDEEPHETPAQPGSPAATGGRYLSRYSKGGGERFAQADSSGPPPSEVTYVRVGTEW